MAFGDGIFRAIDSMSAGIADWFRFRSSRHCSLQTASGDVLVARDNTMSTVFRVDGLLSACDKDSLTKLIDALSQALESRLDQKGHGIQVVIHHDPDQTSTTIDDQLKGARQTSREIGLDTDDIIEDWRDRLSEYATVEYIFLVAFTRPSVMPKTTAKQAQKNAERRLAAVPRSMLAQDTEAYLEELSDVHNAFAASIESALKSGTVPSKVEALGAHDALWWIRYLLDPDWTHEQWRPLLPGDRIPRRLNDAMDPPSDRSSVLYPRVDEQVWPREAEDKGPNEVRIGDRLHAPVMMSLPPSKPKPFQQLHRALIQHGKRFPWRVSFLLEGDGLSVVRFRRTLAQAMRMTNKGVNSPIVFAIKALEEQVEQGRVMGRLRIHADTWTWAHDADAYERVRRQAAELSGKMQSWGGADTQEATGDPLPAVASAVPAMTLHSPSPSAAPQIPDALLLMPLTRPASPWKKGTIPFRSPSGKLMPFEPGSSKQAAWIDCGFAPMGGGKSALLSSMKLGIILRAGQRELPFITTIDVGKSSKGLIDLLRAKLPEDKRHQATYAYLRNEARQAINPFDTPLGARYPLPSHRDFLLNFLSLLATPPGSDRPPEGTGSMVQRMAEEAYRQFSDMEQGRGHPKPYTPTIDEEVARTVEELGIAYTEGETSWWQIVDGLYDQGQVHMAARAQRYAVPTLVDVGGIASQTDIRQAYEQVKTESGEKLLDYLWRKIAQDAPQSYPVLKDPTRFDLGDSRVLSLDLNEVAPRGGSAAEHQSATMYMLARHVGAAHFFYQEADADNMPERYQAFHRKRIQFIRKSFKRLDYDEFHRTGAKDYDRGNMGPALEQVVMDIETKGRETRKWNLSIGIYTQSDDDIPRIITDDLATSVFMLGAGASAQGIDRVAKRFGLNPATRHALETQSAKPGRGGSSLIGYFHTEDGRVQHPLMLTVGPKWLWVISSTAEDDRVRGELYKRLGVERALDVLTRKYPSGSVQREVENRRTRMTVDEDQSSDVIQDIVDELAAAA